MASRSLKTTPAVAIMKCLLVIFTTVLLIVGACLFGGGIYSKVEMGNYDLLTTENYSSAPYIMIGIGVFIILTGIFGSIAIAKGNTCMLRTYGITLGILFLAEFIFAIVVVVYQGSIRKGFEDGTKDAIKLYKNTTYPSFKNALDNAQQTLKCCGSNNYTDYSEFGGFAAGTVPKSCCKSEDSCRNFISNDTVTLPPESNATDNIINTVGCPLKVFTVVDENLAAILGSMFGVAFFQLVGLVLSCCLASTINANKYELV